MGEIVIRCLKFIVGLYLALSATVAWPQDKPSPLMVETRELIREQAQAVEQDSQVRILGQNLYAGRALSLFYHRAGHWPAWASEDALKEQIPALLAELEAARLEGLEPEAYHLGTLQELLQERQAGQMQQAGHLAGFDLLLTDAYLLFASHRLSGVVNPETYDPEWFSNRREADIARLLQTALLDSRVRSSLLELKPDDPHYEALEVALQRYRQLAENGGWAPVPQGDTLEKGQQDPRVVALRQRLQVTGDLKGKSKPKSDRFGVRVEAAVKRFQARHGLEVDGRVGPRTLAALNVPVKDRIEQIKANLERWRWLPEQLGDPHIRVNAADFGLQLFEDGRPVMEMKVIVGMPYRRTPVFSSHITHLIVNPYWYVPRNIAVKDKLPIIQEDPGYLERNGFEVLSERSANASLLDADDIDWEALSEDDFPYLLRQKPGPDNALGRVKFMFPNRYNVYLHDTPARQLFSRSTRTFSSGCIRLERPLQLAEYLLSRDPDHTDTDIRQLIESGERMRLDLSRTIAVHLLYWTAWVDTRGVVQFRKDIYNRDTNVIAALRRQPVN